MERARGRVATLVLVCGAVLATGCGGGPDIYVVDPVELGVSVVLTSPGDFRVHGDRCSADTAGRYPGIRSGIDVVVSDDSDRGVGQLMLGEGEALPAVQERGGPSCSFYGYTTGLPESESYTVEVVADRADLAKRVSPRSDGERTEVEFELP